MVVNSVINKLQDLGFSENEARAYVALLPHDAISAYELAHHSGIPSSKIYQVLGKLCEKEAVVQLEEGGKTLYAAQNPQEVIASRRTELEQTLKGLESDLETFAVPTSASYVWNLRQEKEFLNRARLMIANCHTELLLSAYETELGQLEGELAAAAARGVKIALVHFGPCHVAVGQQYYHPIEDTLAHEHGGRTFTLCADRSIALTATISTHGKTDGAWSRSAGFVLLAEDYIKHDIYLTKIVARFDHKLTKTFGKRYKQLRDIHHDHDHKEGDEHDHLD